MTSTPACDFYFTGDDYRYRIEHDAKLRFIDILRERFNSGVRYKGRVLKWDTVILEKTSELGRYLNGRCQRLDFSEPAPYKIRLKICKKSKQVEFSLNFNLDEADPFQFVYFVEFVRQTKKENRLILRLADGKVLQEGPFPVEFEAPTEDWMRILRALAEIQHKTSIRLPIPKSVSSDDLNKIDRLYQITTKGEIDAQANSLTVNFS